MLLKKGITDEYKIERIIHSVRELQNANLLEGYKIGDDINGSSNECRLTEVGNEVADFLK